MNLTRHCLTCGANYDDGAVACPTCDEQTMDLRDPDQLALAEREDYRRRARHDHVVVAVAVLAGLAVFPFAWIYIGAMLGTVAVVAVATGAWAALSAVWRYETRLPPVVGADDAGAPADDR